MTSCNQKPLRKCCWSSIKDFNVKSDTNAGCVTVITTIPIPLYKVCSRKFASVDVKDQIMMWKMFAESGQSVSLCVKFSAKMFAPRKMWSPGLKSIVSVPAPKWVHCLGDVCLVERVSRGPRCICPIHDEQWVTTQLDYFSGPNLWAPSQISRKDRLRFRAWSLGIKRFNYFHHCLELAFIWRSILKSKSNKFIFHHWPFHFLRSKCPPTETFPFHKNVLPSHRKSTWDVARLCLSPIPFSCSHHALLLHDRAQDIICDCSVVPKQDRPA